MPLIKTTSESKLLLGLATLVHGVSYFTPMRFNTSGFESSPDSGKAWGEILWNNVISDLLEGNLHLDWYAYACTLSPLLMLFIVGLYYLLFWQRPKRLPPTWLLVIGLLGTSSIIPAILIWEWLTIGRFHAMWGFFIWDVSFWLFFVGFYTYKKVAVKHETTLADHLIDED